ncbi:MAG TPA: restriction endonuclease subunit S [Acidovorax sp.]|nr:restriction endonuclease subunit S [Acidovorax sp.]
MNDAALRMKLGDLAHIRAGHPFRGAVEAVPEGAVAVVQMKDILPGGGVDWSSAVRTELVGRKEPDWLSDGDLLFVSRGSRYFAVCVDSPPAPAVCGPHLFHLTVSARELLMPEFLAWVVGQGPVQRQLLQAASGSLQLSVTRQALEALEIPLPPLATQRVVTALAAAAARERAVLTALINNRELQLEALASALAAGQPMNFT